MAIWLISDFHLSLSAPFAPENGLQLYKPMEVFGDGWDNHIKRLWENWQSLVAPTDTVFVPGDISWAISLAEGKYDFAFLGDLPGNIVISKGNHDYWWDTKAKVMAVMPPNVCVLQNESYAAEGVIAAAARGWYCPGSADFNADAAKIYRRELLRLEMALQNGVKQAEAANADWERWVVMHFPPVNDKRQYNEMIELMQKYDVRRCFYGHLHGVKGGFALQGEHWGIEFALVSTDFLEHRPFLAKS